MIISLIISYDGTNYNGWQKQPYLNTTIQQKIEDTLNLLTHCTYQVTSAGRTDAGVHAKAMPCAFVCEHMPIPINRLHTALNSHLPDDIRVHSAHLMPDNFHPIASVYEKTYTYTIHNHEINDVFLDRYSWHIKKPIDIEKARQASKALLGTHDFKGFSSVGSSAKTTRRTIKNIELTKENTQIKINITGNGFLYNMVRIIAGTLVAIGTGSLPETTIETVLQTKDRTKAGQTAPACGLTMASLTYKEEFLPYFTHLE